MMQVLYEDNHIIIVNKQAGEIVQGDKTGDEPLVETVKQYIKEAYAKPGNVFLGVVHRLDRPVSGLVIFARTSKALSRLNDLFRKGEVHKTYWCIVEKTKAHASSGEGLLSSDRAEGGEAIEGKRLLTHWLVRNEKKNKSYAYEREVPNSKKAVLEYRLLAEGDHYDLVEVDLKTGRHHQIRCQLSKVGMPIRGDLKYGARRSNPDGSISLCAHSVDFIHPVTRQPLHLEAPLPPDSLWTSLQDGIVGT